MSRVRANNFTDKAGTGAPTFPYGAIIVGVATATSFSGNVTGNVTGNVNGNLTGNVTGNVTGNADTATTANGLSASATGTNLTLTGDLDVDGHTELDNVRISGVLTATSAEFSGNVTVLGDLTYENVTSLDSIGIATARSGLRITGGGLDVVGVSTFDNDLSIADKIIHTGDTDTAIRFPAADTFTVETAGSERLRVTSDGKLGLNYNNPTTIIHAIGNNTVGTSVTCKLQSHDTPNATANLELLARDSSNNNETCRIRAASEGTTNVDLQFHTNNTERLRITSSGNVGIGTDTSLTDILTINDTNPKISIRDAGTERAFIEVDSSDNLVINNKSVSNLIFETSDTERLRIKSSGDVGINTTTIEQLDVFEPTGTNSSRTLVRFQKDHTQTSVTGATGGSDQYPHALCLENQDTSADTGTVSLVFSKFSSGVQSQAIIAGIQESAGNMALTLNTESGNSIGERLRITSSGTAIFKGGLAEKYNKGTTLAAASNNVALGSGNVHRFTSNESGAQTVNFTGVHSTLGDGESVSFTVVVTPAGSGYINAATVDGVSPGGGLKWSGGSAPSAGGASGRDVYTFTIFKDGTATDSYEIFGAVTNYA